MCYSFESSLTSWFAILLSAMYLMANGKRDPVANRTDVWIALFVLTFGQIQLIEAMLWNEIRAPVPDKRKIAQLTSYIPILLWAQPTIQCVGAYYATGDERLLYAGFVYLVILLWQWATTRATRFDTVVGDNGHLVWCRYDGADADNTQRVSILGGSGVTATVLALLYAGGLLAPLLFMPNHVLGTTLLVYGIGSFVYAWAVAGPEYASYWCYLAVGYAVVAIVLGTFTTPGTTPKS